MVVNYSDFDGKSAIPVWYSDYRQHKPVIKKNLWCFACVAFAVGFVIGIIIPVVYFSRSYEGTNNTTDNTAAIRTVFVDNSYSKEEQYPTVSFVGLESPTETIDKVIQDGIYWGTKVEQALPQGYNKNHHETWSQYVEKAVAVKLENGCGRMQNRLVTFQDGLQGCVRYRQNTDQIQGELFSFYLAQILHLPNLAPSAVSVVNLKTPLWQNLANEIAAAQWNSNRPIVLTQYISNLDPANIPPVFKPVERHLNKNDVLNMTSNDDLVELAQWSDLIIFDYLTANLDRIVNNLYNYQWNVNIMDAPAHNLAKKVDSDLLVFLDNESGLLHGYRLLKKYEIYHSLLLENLCIFRKQTADIIKTLKERGNVGVLLREMFEERNSEKIKDVLPTLPDKSVKILNERIETVYNQIVKCESLFSGEHT